MPENHSLAEPALALRLEQARRWRQGDRAPAEEYLARHPEMGTDPEYALEVIFGELLLREEEGERPGAEEFVRHYTDLLGVVLPGYEREGKRFVAFAVGCTGGMHRSVAIADELAARLAGTDVQVVHRDLGRDLGRE